MDDALAALGYCRAHLEILSFPSVHKVSSPGLVNETARRETTRVTKASDPSLQLPATETFNGQFCATLQSDRKEAQSFKEDPGVSHPGEVTVSHSPSSVNPK